jgi:dGTPase
MSNNLFLVRRQLEEREEQLSPFASKSRSTRGRLRPEVPSPVRLEYQRDRDRIIHCNSFRRLKHKTQVFIAPVGDHFVTRLTHTLEVSQIARTLSRALNLNEDLTEAISLGHDLGHTPFGHIGEDALNELFPGGFRHNEQSLRVVDILENSGRGLNLTWEVREGILNHSKTKVIDILGDDWGSSHSFEGDIVKISDAVAYINHDIDDAIRANLISEADLPEKATGLLGHSRSERINTMVCDIINTSWVVRGTNPDVIPKIMMSENIREATSQLHIFLYQRVYNLSSAKEEAESARNIVRKLYYFFCSHPELLPSEYLTSNDNLQRRVVDYIAGMTDQYAERKVCELDISANPHNN